MKKQKQVVREPTNTQILELIDLATEARENMKGVDGTRQSILLFTALSEVELVYGLWPDPKRLGGYAYTLIKGELGSDYEQKVASGQEIHVGAVFRESEKHAGLTRDLYASLDALIDAGSERDDEFRVVWSMWLGIAPFIMEATNPRFNCAWTRAHRA